MSVTVGDFVALIGPNGAGKTTLLRCLAGAIPYSGSVSCLGKDISRASASERAGLISYLPQNGLIHWPMKVRDIVELGRLPFVARSLHGSREAAGALPAIMQDCGIDHLADRIATELSGGERARVLLARAMATEARVLLADEPLASLDPKHQLSTMETLRRYARSGTGVIAVMHDIASSLRFANRIIVMQNGRIAGAGRGEDLLSTGLLDEVFQVRFKPGFDADGTLSTLAVTQKT
ncbi:MAG: ABC transporter ATP-binding protein [Hyphomicrobiales bacterium]|nr:ABC transporter ATP-binding protein [Hyphomicrobiales bacterium]